MNKCNVVKKFDALAKKYGFDQDSLIDMLDIDEETKLIEQALFQICDAHCEQRVRKNIQTKEGGWTAYGVVALKCAHLMNWCLNCFDSAYMVLTRRPADRDTHLRKCSLAYEVYWHLNSDFFLRSAMNNVLSGHLHVSSFLRGAHTFQHADLDIKSYRPMLNVVSEIASLSVQYGGELPQKKKPALKPWLLATQTKSNGWELPTQGGKLKLDNREEVQVIQGDTFSILLCYDQASLVLGPETRITEGKMTVIHQGKIIYSGEHSFSIDLDRNNAYAAIVDRWDSEPVRWVSEMLLHDTKHRLIAAHAEEIETLIWNACANILSCALSNGSGQSVEVHESLYSLELECFDFACDLFGRLRPEYLTLDLCAYAVSRNYRCLALLPKNARNNLRIGLAALKGSYCDNERLVWGQIFSETEMPLEALAKEHIKEGGSQRYTSLPPRLKTEEMLRYTVETHPDCLNYTTNTSVFQNCEEFEAFLERQVPGLAKHVRTIMDTAGHPPRQAYESALMAQALTVPSEQLPTLDFSDFGIPA